MMQIVRIVPQFINADDGIFVIADDDPDVPAYRMRILQDFAPIKEGFADPRINKQYRP